MVVVVVVVDVDVDVDDGHALGAKSQSETLCQPEVKPGKACSSSEAVEVVV